MTFNIKHVPPVGGGRHRREPRCSKGTWKIVYADFTTSMMCVFVLLWILTITSKEQRESIFLYFENAQTSKTLSQRSRDPSQKLDSSSHNKQEEQNKNSIIRAAIGKISESIQNDQSFASLRQNIIIDEVDAGLRIQLIDRENISMFALGKTVLLEPARAIIKKVTPVLLSLPNKITITGHTDALPMWSETKDNWDLSSERAHAIRKALIAEGLPDSRIEAAIGKAETEPLEKTDPLAPQNRRYSILILRNSFES